MSSAAPLVLLALLPQGASGDERAAAWLAGREQPAPATWTDGDPRTFAELDPGDSGDARIGLLFPQPRPLRALTVDFLSLYEHVYEGVPSACALELLAPDGWCPVAATLERDVARQGELARYQKYGGVAWRLSFPRCEARGVRLFLRRAADERAPWRRFVVRELAVEDDATAPLHAIEGDSIGSSIARSRDAARPEEAEESIDQAVAERGAVRSFDDEGVVIEWPRARFLDEVEVAAQRPAPIEWWDGSDWRGVALTGMELSPARGRHARATTRFLPVATRRLRVIGIPESASVVARLGADARDDAERVAASGPDLLLQRATDFFGDPEYGTVAGALLPLEAHAAVIGRPGDPVETLVTWNGTLHETEHGDEGPWNHGAPPAAGGESGRSPGGGSRRSWTDRWCAFALQDRLVGEEPDAVSRRLFDGGRPGVETTATQGSFKLTLRAFVTAPGDPIWGTVVTLLLENRSDEAASGRVSAILGRRRNPFAARGELGLAPLPTGHRAASDGRALCDEGGALVAYSPDATALAAGTFESTLAFESTLPPGGMREFRLLLPSVNAPAPDEALAAGCDFAASAARFEAFWSEQLATFELALPEAPFNELVPALLAQCHVVLFDEARESLRLKYGAYAYEDYFGLEEAWPTLALAQFGQLAAAERAAERMLAPDLLDPANYHHQYRMGVAATTAARVFALSRDAAFLARIRPRLDAVADWIVAARHRDDGAGHAWEGLLPKHAYGGDVTMPARSLYADAACWRGLHEIALLRREGPKEEKPEAERTRLLSREAADFRARIVAVAAAAADRSHEPPFVPMAVDLGTPDDDAAAQREPSYDFLPGDPLGNYWSLFAPLLLETGVFPAEGELSTWIRAMRAERGGSLLHLARFHRAIDPVYGLGGAFALAEADDSRGYRMAAYAFLAHALDRDVFTGGEVEGVFPLRTSNVAARARLKEARWHWNLYGADAMGEDGGRALGSEPLSASAGVGLELVRRLLIEERPDRAQEQADDLRPRELHLLRLAPSHWLADGKRLRFRLPTEFGEISLSLESHVDDGAIVGTAELTPRGAPLDRPDRIVLWLVPPDESTIELAWVDGHEWNAFGDNVLALPASGAHEFRVEF